jgi:hypothetical protein
MTIKFKDLVEKSGAGDWGTKELTDTLRKDTPGQGITDIGAKNKAKLEEKAPKIDPDRLNRILKIPKFKITYGGAFHTVQAKDTDEALKKAWKLFKLAAHVKLAFMKSAKIDRMHEESLEEAFTTKEIRQAVGIATDKRYAGGNMTGATQAIEKLKKGLSKHPQIRAVLRRVNEAYRKPTAAEIAADKRKDGKKPEGNRQSSIKKKVYGNAMGGLKEGRQDVIKNLANKAKTGGIDKADFKKAHDLYKDAKVQDLKKHIKGLDTDVAEYIADCISRHDSKTFNSMYPRAKSGDSIAKIVREDLQEGAVSVSTVEKEIRSNGGSKIKKTDRSMEFTYRGSAHTIPLDRGFVRDSDYMKLQHYFG